MHFDIIPKRSSHRQRLFDLGAPVKKKTQRKVPTVECPVCKGVLMSTASGSVEKKSICIDSGCCYSAYVGTCAARSNQWWESLRTVLQKTLMSPRVHRTPCPWAVWHASPRFNCTRLVCSIRRTGVGSWRRDPGRTHEEGLGRARLDEQLVKARLSFPNVLLAFLPES